MIDLLAALAIVSTLGFIGCPLVIWVIAGLAWLWFQGAPVWLLITLGAVSLQFLVPILGRRHLSDRIMAFMKAMKFLPAISPTEQTAIEAGTVWIDRDLFSGKPDFGKLMREPYPDLTDAERAFLDGPVEEVCRMTNDWEVYKQRDLPPEVWTYLKENKFFGMIVPEEYGGLGFSASANSAVVQKLGSRSLPLSISVMVPNSLGPAELLNHYGTPEQKAHYLPRLATGEDMPCFALTEPGAGSDATSLTSSGVVFKAEDGSICLRLTWNKRYISLAAISTVLGLAVVLRDPDNLLGLGTEPGITCVLVPTSTPGVEVNRRHDPLGIPFYNCPTSGQDVVVPVDAIIGGPEGAGRGWQMLTECLAAGRGISLPAGATGGVKGVAAAASAHAAIRVQFGLPIGKFEGIEERLARIGSFAYLLEAARRYTCGAIDTGAKPAVVTAIAKYNFTELARIALNDGMDVLAGNAISRGPRNLLAHGYIGMPISITVEGANILTRTLIVFGQGAIRCHPYAYDEIVALTEGNGKAFDRALWKHVGHVIRNGFRATLGHLSRGLLFRSPVPGPTATYYRKLSWASASFALLADLAMAGLGGNLKRKEAVTGRFADIFSWLYLGTATLRRFEADGRPAADLPYVHWSMQYAFARIQEAFEGLLRNLELPGLTWALRGPLSWWLRISPFGSEPSDRIGHRVSKAMQTPGADRDRLVDGIYSPKEMDQAARRLEHAFELCVSAEAVTRKIKDAVKAKKLEKASPAAMLEQARELGIVSAEEAEVVTEAQKARTEALTVDSFTLEEYLAMAGPARTASQSPAHGDVAASPQRQA